MRPRPAVAALLTLAFVAGCARIPGQDVPDVRTPLVVVNEMLKLAGVTAGDTVYDLGSGDGRIVIAAARDRGARGVGFEIDPALVAEATDHARRLRLTDRVSFTQADLFQADLRPATVVMLYLSPDLNRRLRSKLLSELRPGSRIVSHAFDMGDWAPTRTLQVTSNEGTHTLYLWVVPGR
jgi:SAM-dependent methyltransferase